LNFFFQSKKALSRQYLHFLDKTGLSVHICQLRWYSPAFNRLFLRIGQWKPGFLRAWFTVGVFVALVTMLLSVFLLSLLVFNTIKQKPVEQQVLTPVVRIAFFFKLNFVTLFVLFFCTCMSVMQLDVPVALFNFSVGVTSDFILL
jgi:hypothetical protein